MSLKKIDGLSNLNYKGTDHAYQMSGGSSNSGETAVPADAGVQDITANIRIVTYSKIEIDASLLNLFTSFISSILKQSKIANRDDLQKLNEIVGGTLSIDRSPKADLVALAMSETPYLGGFVLSNKVAVHPSVLSNTSLGMCVVTFVGEGIIPFFLDEPYDGGDQFFWIIETLDSLRLMFSTNLIKHLVNHYPSIIDFYGLETLKSIFGMPKQDFKMNLFLVSYVVENLMSENKEVHNLWVIMFQWLMFLRYTELLVAVMSQAVQLPKRVDMTISGSFLEKLKIYLQELNPAIFIKRFSQVSFEENCRMLMSSFEEKIQELGMLYEHISRNIVFPKKKLLSHLHELQKMMEFHNDQISPKTFSMRMALELFQDPKQLSEISHSTDPIIFLRQMIATIRQNATSTPSRDFFHLLNDEKSFFVILMKMEIEQLKMQKRLLDEKIEIQKKEQELIREQEKTDQMKKDQAHRVQQELNSRRYFPRDSRDPRDNRDSRDHRDSRDSRDPRDNRDSRDHRDSRDRSRSRERRHSL